LRVEKKIYSTNDRDFDFEAAVLKIDRLRTGRTDLTPGFTGWRSGSTGWLTN